MSYNQRTTCVHYNLAPRLLPMQNNEGVLGYIQNQNIAYMCKGGYSFNGYIENVPTPLFGEYVRFCAHWHSFARLSDVYLQYIHIV